MDRGWTKRWRKSWDKGYHKNLLLWALMDYFIDHAAHKDCEIFYPGVGMVKLKRGEAAFGTPSLARFFSVGRQRIRSHVGLLENIKFLTTQATIKPTTLLTIATVLNYDKYQSQVEFDQPPKQPSNQPDTNQGTTTIQELKELKEETEEPILVKPEDKTKKKNNVSKYPSDFEKFWSIYPKKHGKADALKSWKRINPDDDFQQKMITAVTAQSKTEQWMKNDHKFVPDPATWLNKGKWDDEPTPTTPKNKWADYPL